MSNPRTYTTALELLTEVAAALTAEGRPVARAFVSPGSRATWDECCEGQLWVTVPSITAPTRPCGETRGSMSVGVLRCAAMIDDLGNPPTPDAVSGDALTILQDMETVYRVLSGYTDYGWESGVWSSLGPFGGCVGGVWTVRLPVGIC